MAQLASHRHCADRHCAGSGPAPLHGRHDQGSDQSIFGNAVRLYGGNIQVHAPGYVEKANRMPLLPLDDADAVVEAAYAQPEVVSAAKRINTGGMIISREGAYPVAITAIEPSVEAPVSIQAENVVEGRYLMDEDLDAVFIGRALADLLDVTVGDRVTLLGRAKHETMRQRTMTVVGIYDLGAGAIEKGVAFITLPEAQTLYDLRDQVTEVAVSLQKVGQEKRVVPALERVSSQLRGRFLGNAQAGDTGDHGYQERSHRVLWFCRGLHCQYRHPESDVDGGL